MSSEKSFGARLGNARIFHNYIDVYSKYEPPTKKYVPLKPELSVDAYHALIDEASASFDEVDAAIQDYSIAVDTRQKVFRGDKYSLEKVLTKIYGAVQGTFDKTAKEVTTLASMVKKMRSSRKKTKDKTSDAVSISQSERGYNNLTQRFAGIIASLDKNRDLYNPPNPDIQMDALRALLQKLIENNLIAANKLLIVRQKRDRRSTAFKVLHVITQRIKPSISSQYDFDSIEFTSIKGLVI